ncbi:MAG: dihydrodipicolinate synthase family protein [Burkholderiaceae bacterium]|nr:dihydrodipicolinate synthase family protein [Burkholderiaceae bacterium]
MKIDGVLVPIVTPFDANNQLNLKALEALVEKFIAEQVTGIVACGTTGEYYALSDAEREQVLRTVAKVGKGRITLIAGINSLSPAEAIARAKQAQDLGYEGLMLSPTPYSLPGQHEVVAYYKHVAAATSLPIIMYNFPARIGVEIGLDAVIELSKVSNIVAIKESSGDFSRAIALIHAGLENFQVIIGCDDQAADFLFWGVRSWISGGANVFPGEQAAMIRAADKGDWDQVRSMMAGMLPAIQAMESGDYNQKAKLGVRRHGIDVGSVRLPLLPLASDDAQAFQQLLDQYQA